MRETVNDCDPNVEVVVVLKISEARAPGQSTDRERVLSNLGRARRDDVWRVELRVHGVGLAGVDHKEEAVIPGVSWYRLTPSTCELRTFSSPTSAQRHRQRRKRRAPRCLGT